MASFSGFDVDYLDLLPTAPASSEWHQIRRSTESVLRIVSLASCQESIDHSTYYSLYDQLIQLLRSVDALDPNKQCIESLLSMPAPPLSAPPLLVELPIMGWEHPPPPLPPPLTLDQVCEISQPRTVTSQLQIQEQKPRVSLSPVPPQVSPQSTLEPAIKTGIRTQRAKRSPRSESQKRQPQQQKSQPQQQQQQQLFADDVSSSYSGDDNFALSARTHEKRRRSQKRRTLNQSCANCHATSTPEWRKGPDGTHSLCNACGLSWAKMQKKVKAGAQATDAAEISVPPAAVVSLTDTDSPLPFATQ